MLVQGLERGINGQKNLHALNRSSTSWERPRFSSAKEPPLQKPARK